MNIAIVTGASSGIGRSFAFMIDKHYELDEIWVVARRADRLEALGDELKTKIKVVALDLTKNESYDSFAELLNEQKPNVKVLVNASGYGYFGTFSERSLEGQLRMIDLNDKAIVALTHHTLKYMTKGAEIYNIASSSSFQPVPYITVYGATKAFVTSFSRALNAETKHNGIRVMAVCPHWCKTEFFDTAVMDDTIKYYNFFTPADAVSEAAYKNMKRGRDVSLCGFKIKFQVFLVKILPHTLVMKIWCRQQKKPV